MKIKDKEFQIFIEQEHILKRVKELGQQISAEYAGLEPVIIPLLNGAFLFAADLIKEITIPCQVSFVKTSSYKGLKSTGNVKNLIGLDMDLRDRNVIILDDIIDTGLTMHSILEEIKDMAPATIEVATFLLKPEALQKEVQARYVGFTIPNSFVVGYGLDYDGLGRNLRDIYRIKS